MSAWYDRYITMKPGVQGGAPIIRNTRTPIRSIVLYLRAYDGNIDEVRRAMPHLSHEQIDAALAYYHDAPWAVDANIKPRKKPSSNCSLRINECGWSGNQDLHR